LKTIAKPVFHFFRRLSAPAEIVRLLVLAVGWCVALSISGQGAPLPWVKPLPGESSSQESAGPGQPSIQDENDMALRSSVPPEDAEDVTPGSDTPRPVIFDRAGQPDQLADHLLVVYNSKDLDSRALAYYYAQRRHIPTERVLPIACSLREEITRSEYDATIRQPIIGYLFQHKWMDRQAETVRFRGHAITLLTATRNDIWAIVLIRGVPLKIASSSDFRSGMQTEPNFAANGAAVDSELALLPVFGLPLGGFVPNPFFDAANSGELRAGPELATHLILVTRLDGPTPACVRRIIDDTLAAETHRLAGEAVIDSRGLTDPKNPYTLGDAWLRKSRELLAADGWTVAFDDRPKTLPATDPVNHVALYLGWYTTNADGPWTTPPDRFVPGAIAYHLHSFSAATVRSTTNNWVGPLLQHGVAATMGAVYEPYLGLTPRLDVFTRRLLDGDSFAEAAYASQLGLSWMITVVGDPLYRPFQLPIEEALAAAGPGPSDQRDVLLLEQTQRRLALGTTYSVADLKAALDLPGAGPLAEEGLGNLLLARNDPGAGAAAENAFQKALRLSTEPLDSIRIGLELAHCEAAQHHEDQAENELRDLRKRYPADAPRFGVVDGLLPR
jgi:uncharacterized protein (TIGR03790 family)